MKMRHLHILGLFDRLLSSDHLGDLLLSFLSTEDLLSLRLTSRAAARLVDRILPRLFERLYATPLLRYDHDDFYELERLQQYCKELVIRFPQPTDPAIATGEPAPSLSSASPQQTHAPEGNGRFAKLKRARIWPNNGTRTEDSAPCSVSSTATTLPGESIRYWRGIFTRLPNLAVLTLSCPGQPPWPGYQAVEKSLVTIRQTLESTSLPCLTSLRLDPIHAMGVLHLRWGGATAFESADWMSGMFWSRIRILHLSLMYPTGLLGKDHQRIFIKILHDYLGSFSGFIEELRFQWLGTLLGPNPLFLEQVMAKKRRGSNGVSSFSSPVLRWGPALKRIILQGCQWDVMHVKTLFEERAPGLQECSVEGNVQGPLEGLVSAGIGWREEVHLNDEITFVFSRIPGAYNVQVEFDISQNWPAGSQDEDSLYDEEASDEQDSDGEEKEGEIPIIFVE